MISPLNKLKLVADLFGDQLIRNTRRVNIEIGDFSSFIRYRPRRDKDEIRHERRYGALEKGWIAQDDVLVVDFDDVTRTDH